MQGHYKIKKNGQETDIYSVGVKTPRLRPIRSVSELVAGHQYFIRLTKKDDRSTPIFLKDVGLCFDNVHIKYNKAPTQRYAYDVPWDYFFGYSYNGVNSKYGFFDEHKIWYRVFNSQSGSFFAVGTFVKYLGTEKNINDNFIQYIYQLDTSLPPEKTYVATIEKTLGNNSKVIWVAPNYYNVKINASLTMPPVGSTTYAVGYHPYGLYGDNIQSFLVVLDKNNIFIEKVSGLTSYDPPGSISYFTSVLPSDSRDEWFLSRALCSYGDTIRVQTPITSPVTIAHFPNDKSPIYSSEVEISITKTIKDVPTETNKIHDMDSTSGQISFKGLDVTATKLAENVYRLYNNSPRTLYYGLPGLDLESISPKGVGLYTVSDTIESRFKDKVIVYRTKNPTDDSDYQVVSLPQD